VISWFETACTIKFDQFVAKTTWEYTLHFGAIVVDFFTGLCLSNTDLADLAKL